MLASFMFCVPKLCIIIALIPDIFHVSKKYFISGFRDIHLAAHSPYVSRVP